MTREEFIEKWGLRELVNLCADLDAVIAEATEAIATERNGDRLLHGGAGIPIWARRVRGEADGVVREDRGEAVTCHCAVRDPDGHDIVCTVANLVERVSALESKLAAAETTSSQRLASNPDCSEPSAGVSGSNRGNSAAASSSSPARSLVEQQGSLAKITAFGPQFTPARTETCPRCRGYGDSDGFGLGQCPVCSGTGTVPAKIATIPAIPIDAKDEALVDGLMKRRMAKPKCTNPACSHDAECSCGPAKEEP